MNKIKNLILFLLVLFTSIVYFYKLDQFPLHFDEHAMTKKSPIIFQEHFNPHFQKQFWLSYMAYDHPSLAFMIYGVVDTAVYKSDWRSMLESVNYTIQIPLTDSDYYGSGVWWVDCVLKTNPLSCIPTEFHGVFKLILLNRYVSVTLGILTLILVYLIGKQIGSYSLGLLSFILLAQNRIFYNHSRWALLDIPFLFFELLLSYLLIKIFSRIKSGSFPSFKKTLIIAVACGLVASTKINGFMFPVIVSFIYLIYYPVHILIIYLLSFLVFFVLNPFLWFTPIKNFIFMFQWRQSETQSLMLMFPHQAYPEFSQRLIMVIRNLFFNQGCCSTFKYLNLPQILNPLFFILGISYLLKQRKFGPKILLILFTGIFISMVFYLKLDFDRYFLPIIPFVVMIQSLGIIFLLSQTYRFFKKKIK